MQQILITGASGLLGSNLVLMLGQRFQVAAAYHQHPIRQNPGESLCMDITQEEECETVCHRLKPHAVIHCAAETRVDYCEEHPELAFPINVDGTRNLARLAGRNGIRFVYISTDSVFDGRRGMYTEESASNPLNVYAKTKLLGEQVVRDHVEQHLIIRTSIYGWNAGPRQSLSEWILDTVERGRTLPGFEDIYFSPILVNDLSYFLTRMLLDRLCGTYHLAARERCNKFSFARMLCEVFGKDPALVRPSSSEDAGFKAPRPKDTSLDVRKITCHLGREMPGIWEGLMHFRQLLGDGTVARLRSTYLGAPLAS